MRYACVACNRAFDEPRVNCPDDGAPVVQRDDATQRLVGARLDGRFQVESLLGQGGMGSVYRGTQVSVARTVAIKVLRPELTQSEDVVRRFYREARLISLLNHPNIVSLIDFGSTVDGLLYLVMEFVHGSTLLEEVRRGPLRLKRAVRIAVQVSDALAEAHAKGIVHRDLKPENIVLTEHATRRDIVKVLDFGIATAVDDSMRGATITHAGALIGTPAYMSPEQVSGDRKLTPASDLYALTLILFEMLTGRQVFIGDTPAKVLLRQVTEPPPLLHHVAPDLECPRQLEAFINRNLSKRIEDRAQSADDYKAEMLEVAVGRDYVPGSQRASDWFAPTDCTSTVRTTTPSERTLRAVTEDDIPFGNPHEFSGLNPGASAGLCGAPARLRDPQAAPSLASQRMAPPAMRALKAPIAAAGDAAAVARQPAEPGASLTPALARRRGAAPRLARPLMACAVAIAAFATWLALKPEPPVAPRTGVEPVRPVAATLAAPAWGSPAPLASARAEVSAPAPLAPTATAADAHLAPPARPPPPSGAVARRDVPAPARAKPAHKNRFGLE